MPKLPPQKRLYIADFRALEPGKTFCEVFFLQESEPRRDEAGNQYLALILSDRSGAVEARLRASVPDWQHQLKSGSFIRVSGSVSQPAQGGPRVQATQAAPVDASGLDLRHFLPASFRDTEELLGYVEYFITEVRDADYTRLLESFFGDAEFRRRFCLAPGDLRTHHAYLGGLLEHTVSVATLCQHVWVQHPRLDADLLVTAALLHDVGKVEQYTYSGSIACSREGSLLGHVIMGQEMIRERIRGLGGMPVAKETRLLHAHISHHGELEWGAPKRPQSAEALVLHHIDNLDARVKGFLEVVAGRGEVSWPELTNYFRRPLDEPRAADRER